jgi:Phosphopantetheine attachment site
MPGDRLTTTEGWVMRWWSDILPSPPGTAEDDFFDLGGQSLHLVQFLQLVYEHYHVELPVAELFGDPFTASRTALAIERETGGSTVPGAGR